MTEHEKRLVICALQDYILKCHYMTQKNAFYAPMWTNYQGTANKLIKELKSGQRMKKIYCDVCGEEIGLAENAYIHTSYLYCEKCEQIHIKNQEALCAQKRNQATTGDSAGN